MRGTRRRSSRGSHGTRIIPAHAGNTHSLAVMSRSFRDHPRACGEHTLRSAFTESTLGSSPRMRGTHAPRRSPAPTSRDHPRACGEHLSEVEDLVIPLGSSPRMRGTPHTHNISIPSLGIIPAHAGNTLQICGPGCLAWDHPRACGEHITPNPFANAILGSSPRMRGTLACVPRLKVRTGIIPAHAGNTHGFVVSVPQVQDHPRACGEHHSGACGNSHTLGSSPRMRGTRHAEQRVA